MLSTLLVVLPIFALILAGWLARRLGLLGPHSTTELNRFVVFLALPALLFDIMAHTTAAAIWQPGFAAVFGLGSTVVFALTILIRLKRARPLADAALDGLNAGYANTGFIGFPLVAVALGHDALAATTLATLITVCALFAGAIVLIEIGVQTDTQGGQLGRKVAASLLRNPLLVSPVLGALVPLFGATVPAPVETFLKLLGGAASPCALVALGLFLAQSPGTIAGNDRGPVALLVGAKLLLHPAVTWLLAWAFRLPGPLTHTAVLLAALPTGTGPFMLAEFYGREAAVTSRTILISTVLSVVTVSAYLAVALPG